MQRWVDSMSFSLRQITIIVKQPEKGKHSKSKKDKKQRTKWTPIKYMNDASYDIH